MNHLLRTVMMGIAVALGAMGGAHAQEVRPLRIIVPFAPGGAGDVVARAIAPGLSERLQRPVLVENKPGASTILAADMVAKSAPDGNTLLMTTEATVAINPALMPKLPYDPVKDFVPITKVVDMPLVLVAGPKNDLATVEQVIERARRSPGQLSYASVGAGSPQQLAMVLFNRLSRTEMNHIPYKGGAPAVGDVVGGQVDFFFAAIGTAGPHVASGKLRPIGLTGTRRHPALPQVPTIAEAGLPGYETSVWLGLLAPAGTPPAVVARLQSEVARLVIEPALRERWLALGAEPVASTPAAFAESIRSDAENWGRVIREAQIKAE
ncbi:tripartite tricarboxylate transporter substrate binding protein [Aquabacterium sp. J223]|uniref:Bug family tripartite tricarboxylate transporter substrate binding protein n=1 Tax=Aquabacterium sp. J223 TaxID=2898431 RepID=UPI0021ADC4B9|nr:tripartite tricarboxylate transporter substrate binding protein [Aquabacterium sp. J223]UUX95326.1 tripartite tricarboxylate transporter substrate binding protein [Aquabacterium sp. J223]